MVYLLISKKKKKGEREKEKLRAKKRRKTSAGQFVQFTHFNRIDVMAEGAFIHLWFSDRDQFEVPLTMRISNLIYHIPSLPLIFVTNLPPFGALLIK